MLALISYTFKSISLELRMLQKNLTLWLLDFPFDFLVFKQKKQQKNKKKKQGNFQFWSNKLLRMRLALYTS